MYSINVYLMYDIYIEFGFLKCSNIVVLFVFHFIPYLADKTVFLCLIGSIYVRTSLLERGNIDSPKTQRHDYLLSWLCTDTLIKRGKVKLVLWAYNNLNQKVHLFISVYLMFDIYLLFFPFSTLFSICPFVGPLIWINKILSYLILISIWFWNCSDMLVFLCVFHFIPYLTDKTVFWLIISLFDGLYIQKCTTQIYCLNKQYQTS